MKNTIETTKLVDLCNTCLARAIEEHRKTNECCILAKAGGDSTNNLELLINAKVAAGKAKAFIETHKMLLDLINSSD